MAGWSGWIAAVGGLLVLLGEYVLQQYASWLNPLGAVVAIIFGVWAAFQ